MNPWELLDTAQTPGDGEMLRLYQRDTEFSITAGDYELMNSRVHGSEDALAKLACRNIANHEQARILIGGLGMGYTLRSALNELGANAQVVVAEIVPAVVGWNWKFLADLAGSPLDDNRVEVREADVADIIKAEKRSYDAILLDVDNGPEGLTRKDNDWLYSLDGLRAISHSLQRGGVLGVWSADPDKAFSRRLSKVGFEVEEFKVPARGEGKPKKGWHHIIWTAIRN